MAVGDSADSAIMAFRRITGSAAPFVSRADNSGTHRREMALWQAAGIEPAGAWYVRAPGFMIDGLQRAERLGAYFLTDSSTWLALPGRFSGLRVLFRGDPALVNRYHALTQADPSAGARAFVEYVAGAEGQALIATFSAQPGAEPLYLPAARLPD
jgi:tungstate transport system substrate-binding protein